MRGFPQVREEHHHSHQRKEQTCNSAGFPHASLWQKSRSRFTQAGDADMTDLLQRLAALTQKIPMLGTPVHYAEIG